VPSDDGQRKQLAKEVYSKASASNVPNLPYQQKLAGRFSARLLQVWLRAFWRTSFLKMQTTTAGFPILQARGDCSARPPRACSFMSIYKGGRLLGALAPFEFRLSGKGDVIGNERPGRK